MADEKDVLAPRLNLREIESSLSRLALGQVRIALAIKALAKATIVPLDADRMKEISDLSSEVGDEAMKLLERILK